MSMDARDPDRPAPPAAEPGAEADARSLSRPFIERPVATTLLTIGIALAGWLAFFGLPVAALPQIDFPTISVQAALPGASPETDCVIWNGNSTKLKTHASVLNLITSSA